MNGWEFFYYWYVYNRYVKLFIYKISILYIKIIDDLKVINLRDQTSKSIFSPIWSKLISFAYSSINYFNSISSISISACVVIFFNARLNTSYCTSIVLSFLIFSIIFSLSWYTSSISVYLPNLSRAFGCSASTIYFLSWSTHLRSVLISISYDLICVTRSLFFSLSFLSLFNTCIISTFVSSTLYCILFRSSTQLSA